MVTKETLHVKKQPFAMIVLFLNFYFYPVKLNIFLNISTVGSTSGPCQNSRG